jgi:phage shock protein A
MKALLFSFVVLALGCSQVPKKEEPNPLTVLLEKQADWLAKENDLRDQLREAVRTSEEAERRALNIANDAKDLEEHVEWLQAENKKLHGHAQAESVARHQAQARIQELEQHLKGLKRQLGEAHRMTEAFADQTDLLLQLLSSPREHKPAAKAGICRDKNCRHQHRTPRR